MSPSDFLDIVDRVTEALSRRGIEWWLIHEFHGRRLHVHLLLHNVNDSDWVARLLTRKPYRITVSTDFDFRRVESPEACAVYFTKASKTYNNKKVAPPKSWGSRHLFRRSKGFLSGPVDDLWNAAVTRRFGDKAILRKPRKTTVRTDDSSSSAAAKPAVRSLPDVRPLLMDIETLAGEIVTAIGPDTPGVYVGSGPLCLVKESSEPIFVGRDLYDSRRQVWRRQEHHGVLFVRGKAIYLNLAEYESDSEGSEKIFVTERWLENRLVDLPVEVLERYRDFVRQIRDELLASP